MKDLVYMKIKTLNNSNYVKIMTFFHKKHQMQNADVGQTQYVNKNYQNFSKKFSNSFSNIQTSVIKQHL